MKQKIETIPLIKAFEEKDECPFCCLERQAEQHALSFILGSAYMEDDIREQTDKTGFCRHHYKMMYDYGNRLGSALILSTHMKIFSGKSIFKVKTPENRRVKRAKDRHRTVGGTKRTLLLCVQPL